MIITKEQSLGLDELHLTEFQNHENDKILLVHHSIFEPLNTLIKHAKKDGINIAIVSGYRNFERQLTIWNEKWSGKRPIYSPEGEKLNTELLSNIEKFETISHWSALPGLSRHHWGTDFDIFDYKAIKEGYKVKLIPDEFSQKGVCHKLNQWLTNNLEKFGFFRPYLEFKGGVAAEPWHISHTETSQRIMKNFDMSFCKGYLKQSPILESGFIQDHLEEYYQQYFCNICQEKN